MNPERWQQIDRILEQALEQEHSRRESFLDQACAGDEALRHEVESLLVARQQAGSLLSSPALPADREGLARDSSASLLGQVLGPYQVLALAGRGGMGVVYKARDSRLDRFVALKLLPHAFTEDKDRLRRFEREARAASALNHPNILTIHEIAQASGFTFIATEFIDGETLRQRLSRGRVHLAELLDIAIQVASALDAAHQSHIVHRDIKPENIMLRRDGYVKVLDFGLAKLTEAHSGAQAGETSGAGTIFTQTGMVMGTVQYMSPEQALGQEVDQRTDLFSLGTILYEMATDRPAFQGATPAAVFDAILHQQPISPTQVNRDLPAELERIIHKALQKDRDVRYQTASDLRADLKRIQRDADLVRAAKLPDRAESALPLTSRAPRKRHWLVVGILVGLTVALWMGWYVRQRIKLQPLGGLTQRQLTTNSPETPLYAAAISPDGRYLAYSDESGLYVKGIDSGETHSLPPPPVSKVLHLAWLPNGADKLLASATATNETGFGLWSLSLLGGQPRKLRDDAVAACASPDGATIGFIAENRRSIWLMSANGEQPRQIVQAGQGDGFVERFVELTWFTSSQRLAYIRHHFGDGKLRATIESCDLSGNHATVIITSDQWFNSSWVLPDGRLLYSTADEGKNEAQLSEISVDLRNGQANGTPRSLLNWPGLAFARLSGSSDGKRLGFFRGIAQDDVYVGKLEGNGARLANPQRLTFDERGDYPAAWTADSKAVLFTSERNGNNDIFKQALGQRFAEPVVTGPEDQYDPTVTPDGASILYFDLPTWKRVLSSKPVSLRRAPLAGGPSQLVLNDQGFAHVRCARAPSDLCVVDQRDLGQLTFYAFHPFQGKGRELTRADIPTKTDFYLWGLSPDGSRIALGLRGESRIRILSLTGEGSHDVVVKGWRLDGASWAADGKGLFVSSWSEGTDILLFVDLKGEAHVLWQQPSWFSWTGSNTWGVGSPDGRFLAFAASSLSGNAWLIENF